VFRCRNAELPGCGDRILQAGSIAESVDSRRKRNGHSPNGLPSVIAHTIPDIVGGVSDENILPFGTRIR
jgi:hypothetical protein